MVSQRQDAFEQRRLTWLVCIVSFEISEHNYEPGTESNTLRRLQLETCSFSLLVSTDLSVRLFKRL